MAKGTIGKSNKAAAVRKHSRAARRQTSPGIDLDKSLKAVRPPQESVNLRPTVLAAHHNSGITKKNKKKQLSSKARKRQEKSMDRAEAIMDRTSTKVAKSHGKARVIESRKRTWDEVNVVALAEIGKELPTTKKEKKADKERQAEDEAVRVFYADDDEDMDKDGGEWEDEVEDMDENAAVESLMAAATIPAVAPMMQEDDEEIL
ncbi:Alb1-domain-containing protein [Neurospora tetraspora]|uniref:Alb1-domain-containing protein n=1 Tax=Neurospora tetraspora TaxID=94610 RepID=A0AAE0JLU9_9PEZI|nr:Alb1-domain-containing protein [Neurospora tetraspora]